MYSGKKDHLRKKIYCVLLPVSDTNPNSFTMGLEKNTETSKNFSLEVDVTEKMQPFLLLYLIFHLFITPSSKQKYNLFTNR